MNVTSRILCVEADPLVLETRCSVLKHSGYDTSAASIQVAESLLARQTFDLIVVSSRLRDEDKRRIFEAARGTRMMMLVGPIMPSELLSTVSERLQLANCPTA
jgi:DNA-binding response OmpR family regulator